MVVGDEVNVFDLQYMKKVRFSLNCLGLWPNKQFGDHSLSSVLLSMYNYFLFILIWIAIVGQILYLKNNKNILVFIDLGHVYITILMSFVYMQRVSMPMQNMYLKTTEEFISKFHLMHHRHTSDFAAKMNNQVNKICSICCIVIHYQMYVGLTLFNLVPMYNNYKNGMFNAERPINGRFQHSTYFDFPFDCNKDLYRYTILCLYNWYGSYNISCGFCVLDLLISVMVIHIWGHIKILKHDLKYFPRPGRETNKQSSSAWYTDEENEDVYKRLISIIKYHKMIKEFMSKTSKTYSVTLCLYYAFHQLAGCVLLLECSSLDPDALGEYGLLTFVLFQQLIQLSVIFELISSAGDSLIDAVYSLPWDCMNVRNRRIVLIFLQNVQQPLALKAGDMIPIGVKTMSAIIRTSLSYFVMLKTLAK